MNSDPHHRRTQRGTLGGGESSDAEEIAARETLDAPPAGKTLDGLAARRAKDTVRESGASAPRAIPSRNAWIVGGVAIAVLAALAAWFLPFLFGRIELARQRARLQAQRENPPPDAPAAASVSLADISRQFQAVSQRVGPSVVHIEVVRSAYNVRGRDELRQFFGQESLERAPAQGSGLIVDPAGYILTNYHVVVGAQSIRVTLHDQRRLTATLVGQDTLTDLALLRTQGDNLAAADWGESEHLETGSLVWAIGSPFGLQQSITFGILSKKRRDGLDDHYFQEFLQTDAAVNPGNSGGPLVDANGKVVGINTAILGESYRGVGFAIPSHVARQVYHQLKARGGIERGWLGVELADVTLEQAQELGLNEPRGAKVVSAQADPPSPAWQAGLRPEDIILRWDGAKVNSSIHLSRLVAQTKIGASVPVELIRQRAPLTLQVIVGQRPE